MNPLDNGAGLESAFSAERDDVLALHPVKADVRFRRVTLGDYLRVPGRAGQWVIPDAPGEIYSHPVSDADVDPWQSEWFPFDDSALDDEPA